MDSGAPPRHTPRALPVISTNRALPVFLAFAAAAIPLSGCSADPSTSAGAAGATGCIRDFREGTDYFPDKVRPSDATGFSVEYHNSYKVVTVKQTTQNGPSARYVLVRCGAPQPTLSGDLASAQKITIPVGRVASSSTTQLPAFDLVGALDAVVAVSSPELVNTPGAADRVKSGKITGFGGTGGEITLEKVVAARPDLYLTGGMDSGVLGKIQEARIPVVADTAWLEPTPLGRAEWVKYFALFLDREKRATEAYDAIAVRYRTVRDKAAAVSAKPTVITGRQYKGTWNVAGGQSYVAAYLADAGARYVFADTPGTGTRSVDIETVISRGAAAEFWLNAEMTKGWTSTADVTRDDPRYGTLTALRTGNIWNPVKRVNAAGGNDYWESGVVHPDTVLADLVALLHPDLMPGHAFLYYTKLGS